jgi:transposase
MEIITGVEGRRRWRIEDKLRIVAEAETPGAIISHVARRHHISRGLLSNWRQQVRRGALAAADDSAVFMPVRMLSRADVILSGRGRAARAEWCGGSGCRGPSDRDRVARRHLHPSGRGRRAGGVAPGHLGRAPVIAVPSAVRLRLAVGHTDMRRGMNGLALQVQQALQRDPHAGDLYVFRGKRGDLVKILWHDGVGMSLYAKRLERGRFIWPTPTQGVVSISAAQLGYMLDGIDWRNPQHTWRPQAAG